MAPAETPASQRLETIPGVGIITATALAASVPDPSVFKSGRQFAAWLGLVPRQNSSGGKDRLGRVSKMGNGYLRRLLVVGGHLGDPACANHRLAGPGPGSDPCLNGKADAARDRGYLPTRRARTALALLVKGESYRAAPAT